LRFLHRGTTGVVALEFRYLPEGTEIGNKRTLACFGEIATKLMVLPSLRPFDNLHFQMFGGFVLSFTQTRDSELRGESDQISFFLVKSD
jgi:hypothetical protein